MDLKPMVVFSTGSNLPRREQDRRGEVSSPIFFALKKYNYNLLQTYENKGTLVLSFQPLKSNRSVIDRRIKR